MGETAPGPAPIRIANGQIERMFREATEALQRDETLYTRAEHLVTVAREPDRAAPYKIDERKGREILMRPGTPKIVTLAWPSLLLRLARVAQWERYDPSKERYVPSHPDRLVTSMLLTEPERNAFRPIDMIVEAPYYRVDGTIVQKAGYDRASQCLYSPNLVFPKVPKAPTRDDAVKALADLREIYCDFPFCRDVDRDVPIAAVLSILARPGIDGCVPMFLFDSSTRGSGKSLLTDTVNMLVAGRGAPRMGWPREEEEIEKVLCGYGLRAPASIVFDNATTPFGGVSLDRVLTSTEPDFRILGESKMVAMPWRAVIMGTGNNVTTRGDTERRAVVARLEPPTSHPETRRDFKHPKLLRWIADERRRLVVAALTLLRAYVVAGKPDTLHLGGFEDWAEIVPSAILWAGGGNILDTQPSVGENSDADYGALVGILEHWRLVDTNNRGMTIRAALRQLDTETFAPGAEGLDALREALETLGEDKGRINKNRLGFAFRRLRNRWVDDRQLRRVGKASPAKWMVYERPASEDPAEGWERT